MAHPATSSPRIFGRAPRSDAKRLAITFVTLLAFVLQTLLVQTHIHGTPRIGASVAAVGIEKIASHEQQPDKFPPADDPANCPICQELLHAGAFVTPVAALLQVSTAATVVDVVVVEIATTSQIFSHGWTSRGPPPA